MVLQLEDLRFQQTGEFGGVIFLGEQNTMDAKVYVSFSDFIFFMILILYMLRSMLMC